MGTLLLTLCLIPVASFLITIVVLEFATLFSKDINVKIFGAIMIGGSYLSFLSAIIIIIILAITGNINNVSW